MLDQNTFTETVREVSEIIRTSVEPLTKEQILAYFADMELNEEQQELVISYLLTSHKEPMQQEPEETQAKAEAEGTEAEETETGREEGNKKADKDFLYTPKRNWKSCMKGFLPVRKRPFVLWRMHGFGRCWNWQGSLMHLRKISRISYRKEMWVCFSG